MDGLFAIILVGVGLGIVWKQSKARHCPDHNRAAGYVAMLLAAGCFALAATLLFDWISFA